MQTTGAGQASRVPATTRSHLAPLDGLRGVAVLLVMDFHLFAEPYATWDPLRLGGGVLSIDIFFTLSGFLITSLLISERDRRGRVTLRHFYARRALRLFPALAVLLAASLALALVFDRPWSHPTLIGLPWVAVYLGNWFVVVHGGALPLGLLGQTWSLSVEEQFYLVWPAVLLVLARLIPRRTALAAMVAGFALADMVYRFAAWHWLGWAARDRIYFGSDTHADGLLAGCALALFLSSDQGRRLGDAAKRKISVAAGVACLAMAASLMAFSVTKASTEWLGTPVVVLATVCIIASMVLRPLAPLAWFLSSRPMLWAGTRSYGLYLTQSTLTMALSGFTFGISYDKLACLEIVATFVIASLSFRFVEQPFLRRKRRFSHGDLRPAG